MPTNSPQLEEVIAQFRKSRPPNTATAQAIDRNESWEKIAIEAIHDGYIDIADEFARFVQVCARHGT